MIKFVEYTIDDIPDLLEVISKDSPLVKTAAYGEEIKTAYESLNKKPGHTYILVNALGAGEYYGANRNGDYFPEKNLKEYHKTFEALGRAYKHHMNKNPERSYGKVVHSHYHPDMHRVELIVELINRAARDILAKIDAGQYPAVSMGTKVPYDICSICGNKARSRAVYCEHLTNEMSKTYQDGRKVYAINTQPKFFDLSFVTIPADRTASYISKFAAVGTEIKASAEIAEDYFKFSGIKSADIEKEIEGTVEAVSDDPNRLIVGSQPEIPKETIKELTDKYPLNETLSTLMAVNIFPKKADFQRLVLYSRGMHKEAEELDKMGIVFQVNVEDTPIIPSDVSSRNFNVKIASEISTLIPNLTLTKPRVMARILNPDLEELLRKDSLANYQAVNTNQNSPQEEAGHIGHGGGKDSYQAVNTNMNSPQEEAGFVNAGDTFSTDEKGNLRITKGERNPILALLGLGGLYLGARKIFNLDPLKMSSLEGILMRHPWLFPLLIGGVSYASVEAQKHFSKKASFDLTLLKRLLLAVPASYIYAGVQEAKVRRGEEIGRLSNVIRKHPFLSGLVGTWAVGKGANMLKTGEVIDRLTFELKPEKFESLFNELVK